MKISCHKTKPACLPCVSSPPIKLSVINIVFTIVSRTGFVSVNLLTYLKDPKGEKEKSDTPSACFPFVREHEQRHAWRLRQSIDLGRS